MIARDPACQFVPIHFRHVHVGKDQAESLYRAGCHRIERGGRRGYLIAGPSEAASQELQELLVIIDD
jgi:hypothetical protein